MIDDIFLNNLDYIDLHGYDMESARVATEDFINDSFGLGRKKIVIIHGKGAGLVKKSVHGVLKRDKRVSCYKLSNNNDGMTIVYLLLDKH